MEMICIPCFILTFTDVYTRQQYRDCVVGSGSVPIPHNVHVWKSFLICHPFILSPFLFIPSLYSFFLKIHRFFIYLQEVLFFFFRFNTHNTTTKQHTVMKFCKNVNIHLPKRLVILVNNIVYYKQQQIAPGSTL